MKHKILIISGATASGKSRLALEVANQKNGVIINADSIQLYKELPILSSQPSKEELLGSDHRLYSILAYSDQSSLANWLELANKEIDKVLKDNKLPILVGGTGLYLSKLIDGISNIPQADEGTKNYCAEIFLKGGKEAMIAELLELGESKEKIINLDIYRLLRHLETLKQTGKTISYWQSMPLKIFYQKESFLHINVELDREILYQNCNNRFAQMLDSGAIEEVKNLINLNPNLNSPIIKTIGFLEIKSYLEGLIDKEEVVNKSAQATRNYAKRQLTWFRNQFQDKMIIRNVSRETVKEIINLI